MRGSYRFVFQPYVSTTPIGQPLHMSYNGYYHTFSQTKPLRVLPDGDEVARGSDPADPYSVPHMRTMYLPLVSCK